MSDAERDARVGQDVGEVLVRYATGIDRRDWPLFRTCFTDDCEADYGAIGQWHGVDEITAWMAQTHEPCGHTLHHITNVSVSPDGDDRARARCYVDAVVMGPDGRRGVRVSGFYDDELARTDGAWQIATRRFTLVHTQPLGDRPPG